MPLSHNLAMQNAIARIKVICDKSDGRSQFFPFGGSGYKASVTHYFNSSTEISTCAVQPGSVQDLQSIVKVIADTRVPFAIKCGGHATNPKFSSTEGVQIYLLRFNKITVHKEKKLVDVGAGCLFEELYRELAPYNLNIVGGSGLAGVGVTGWMLGGGYSTKTSQYGLGVDNIESAKLVLPNGEFKEVSATKNSDLFEAIKGGGNNFGIITEFTLQAHHQGKYYDFQLTYAEQDYKAVKDAIVGFVKKKDNKANIEAAFRYHNNPGGIEKLLTVHCVYDGTLPAEDPFKEFRAIEHTMENYGDPLPQQRASPYDFTVESQPTTRTSSFYIADTLRSLENETYDLGELPKELEHYKTQDAKYNVYLSGQVLSITEFVGDGSFSKGPDRPKRPMVGISQYPRGRWGNVMVDEFTPGIIDEIEKQSIEASNEMMAHGGTRIGVDMWPFTKDMFKHATPSAWPHKESEPNCPIIVYFTWEGEKHDTYWVETMKSTLQNLRDKAHTERRASKELPYFISTALAETTSVEELYRGNLDELKRLREKYDPNGVMNLTGGFRIPLPIPTRSTYVAEGGNDATKE